MDGRKELVVNILANLASQHPNDTWAKVPKSTTTYEAGYRCISYSQLQHAVDILAHHIVDALGPGQAFPTLAYFGLWDPRFTMLILAAHKAGYKVSLCQKELSCSAAGIDSYSCYSHPRTPPWKVWPHCSAKLNAAQSFSRQRHRQYQYCRKYGHRARFPNWPSRHYPHY